jgi:RimJ/RimL family protein N-acetyltransferase
MTSKPKRVYLRALEPEDYLVSHKWRNDEEIWNLLTGRRYFVSAEIERTWVQDAIASTTAVILAVCLKSTNEYIGNVYLKEIDWFNRHAMFALLLGEKRCWGQGYAQELTMLMLKHAFYDLGLHRISSYILATNTASTRVHEKCGFSHEGVLRQAVYKNGRYVDLILMSILREEYDALV